MASTRSPASYCLNNGVSVWVVPAFIKSNDVVVQTMWCQWMCVCDDFDFPTKTIETGYLECFAILTLIKPPVVYLVDQLRIDLQQSPDHFFAFVQNSEVQHRASGRRAFEHLSTARSLLPHGRVDHGHIVVQSCLEDWISDNAEEEKGGGGGGWGSGFEATTKDAFAFCSFSLLGGRLWRICKLYTSY